MEAARIDRMFNKMFNREIFKLDRFDRMNYARWKDKILFLLSEVGVAYLLEENLPSLPEASEDDIENLEMRKKRDEDEKRCKGLIFNSLSGHLYDLFHRKKSPQELSKALENKHTSKNQGTDHFLSMKFFEYQMEYNKSIRSQVDDLLVLV
jgi:hypothetical protein